MAPDPTQPCPQDSLNGYHDWAPMEQKGTGEPLPGARYCLACGAMDTGVNGTRITAKDSLQPVFPAGTRSFRQISTHNPDDPSPIADPNAETY